MSRLGFDSFEFLALAKCDDDYQFALSPVPISRAISVRNPLDKPSL